LYLYAIFMHWGYKISYWNLFLLFYYHCMIIHVSENLKHVNSLGVPPIRIAQPWKAIILVHFENFIRVCLLSFRRKCVFDWKFKSQYRKTNEKQEYQENTSVFERALSDFHKNSFETLIELWMANQTYVIFMGHPVFRYPEEKKSFT